MARRKQPQAELTDRQQTIADIEMTEGRTGRSELLRELERLGVHNEPTPDDGCCPTCHAPLQECGGMAGELVLYCPKGCYVWEDAEGAIANVL